MNTENDDKNELRQVIGMFALFGFPFLLVIATSFGFVKVICFLFLVGMLFLPFVLLIFELSKPAKPAKSAITPTTTTYIYNGSGEAYGADEAEDFGCRVGMGLSDDSFISIGDIFCSSDDSFFGSDTSMMDDLLFNPVYSSFECNIYHQDDCSSFESSYIDTSCDSDFIFDPVFSSFECNIYHHDE